MEIGKIGITTTRIDRLSGAPSYNAEKECFVWEIILFDETSISNGSLGKMPFEARQSFLVGTTEEDANECVEDFRKHLEGAKIHDGIMVAVIFDVESGDVRAIAPMREDYWIDLKDRFVEKSFEELGILVSSLEVY